MSVHVVMRRVNSFNQLRQRSALLRQMAATSLIGFASLCSAGPAEEPFYHQLIDLKDRPGYQPTRSFAIVTDAEHGNRLVAEDDPDLRFNILWMDQYQPGYRTRNGGAALGQVLRNYAKSLYKSYRANKVSPDSALPDSEGTGSVGDMTNTDYDLRINGDEVKFGIKYTY